MPFCAVFLDLWFETDDSTNTAEFYSERCVDPVWEKVRKKGRYWQNFGLAKISGNLYSYATGSRVPTPELSDRTILSRNFIKDVVT